MQIAEALDLTYCTNIHPGDGWEEVSRNLAAYGPALKSRLSPDAPFALGLRLSNRESIELLAANRLEEFAGFLREHGLYVALFNGYPYGAFHGAPVKAGVFAPDWRDRKRVDYTLRLLQIAAGILPENGAGGISTLPLSYKPWVPPTDRDAMTAIVRNLVRVAAAMILGQRVTGRRLHLDIEPEPYGLLENSAETVAFYRDWLLTLGAKELAAMLGIARSLAEERILEHIRVCYDTCHFAVAYEEPAEVLGALAGLGVRVGRVQVSSALRVPLPSERAAEQLAPFADSTYLHQVGERKINGARRSFPDLGEALATIGDAEPREWRIHFHVPLFTAAYGVLESTRGHITKLLRLLERDRFTEHLEIETYTWDLLPAAMKVDLLDSIEREYRWVLEEACARPSSLTS
jgi:sugar phosphate isomerase/epimerase